MVLTFSVKGNSVYGTKSEQGSTFIDIKKIEGIL